jgi:photosystem II stability/assembly factor-like uncharacterized protein
MKQLYTIIILSLIAIGIIFWSGQIPNAPEPASKFVDHEFKQMKSGGQIVSTKQRPSDYFARQRAYPYESIPKDKPMMAIRAAQEMRDIARADKNAANVNWTMAGPTNIPGRITDIAVHPTDSATIYVGSAAGGVFKSTDLGQNWMPIFDSAGIQSIGAIAINPQNPDIIYVGTGEANAASDNYEGTGIYKSINGGLTWDNVGLPDSYHIGRIVIDPNHPDTVFVAATGRHFGSLNPERGLYRSTDGGATWDLKLYVNDSTGCIDVALHPTTGTVFAAMWEKVRYKGDYSKFYGQSTGLWRSSDYGDTWTLISGTNGFPHPFYDLGRIGISVDPASNTVYACIVSSGYTLYGVYRSTDLGDTWFELFSPVMSGLYSTFGWYFGQIRVAPGNPDLVYMLGVEQYRSDDGGGDWIEDDEGIHVDHHAMQLVPNGSPNGYAVYSGCDGGVNYKWDINDSWDQLGNMPNSQFYAITIDFNNPERL